MTEGEVAARPPRHRRRRAALAVAGLGGTLLLAGWLSRVPLATRFVDSRLAAAHVPATYRIADLGFGRQRLEDVVIGDPAHPDLVADWIETVTDVGLGGPRLAEVRAGRVLVRGRLVDGKLSLGSIDRLLPKGEGGAIKLPALGLRAEDARMRLETPWGTAGLALTGRGRLDDGFRGTLALASDRLALPGCTGEQLRGVLKVATTGQDPRSGAQRFTLAGPLTAAKLACGEASVATLSAQADAALNLAGGRGNRLSLALRSGPATLPQARAAALSGTLTAALGPGNALTASPMLTATGLTTRGATVPSTTLAGTLTSAAGRSEFTGRVTAHDANLATLTSRLGQLAPGTPLAPLAAKAGTALTRAAQRLSLTADVRAASDATGPTLALAHATATAATGATATLAPAAGTDALTWSADRLGGAALVTLAGGDLPSITARLAARPGGIAGTAQVSPYTAGTAALALTPVRFASDASGTRLTTTATLSGPLVDGRVDRLTIPLDARLTGNDVTLNTTCTPISVDRLAVSSLTLTPTRLTLCPLGPALVRYAGGQLTGGATVAAPRLTGRIGSTPLTLAATRAELRLAQPGATLTSVTATLGAPNRQTHLSIARLAAASTPSGIGGTFAGAAGQIANVPLLLSDATGRWQASGAGLSLNGALKVRDAAAIPRFQPMDGRDVALTLRGGTIAATGTLHEPTTGTKVADVRLTHDLGPGTGHASLAVPGLTFAKGFQPDLLTRLTFGVIADVAGTIRGEGEIAWGADGVTSTGAFTTDKLDLAAAFGPVEGIAGTIRFTDLLALESAPDQEVAIASINPGVAVTDGRIRYRTLANARVQVDSGIWPFAGGTLTLEPTLLDIGSGAAKRMTFRLDGVAADQFLQRFDFKNLDATGTFDGVLPMIFDDSGGRIEGGRITARSGGGKLAYVGPVSEKDLGFWGNFAFQALKSLTYRDLGITMNGPLAGEMVTQVRFAGVKQGEGAKSNFLIRRLTRLPIVFNITIRAPFRGLIDSAASFWDPSRLVQRNLPTLIEEEKKRAADPAIQPPASEKMP